MHKTWKKPLHKRKIWSNISWAGRLVYYMQPLLEHLFDIWLQQLPFPTLLKCIYTCVLLFFMLLPVLYPLMVMGLYYGLCQFVGEKHFNMEFQPNWDLIGAASNLWKFQVTNKKYLLFIAMYIDRYRVIITAISSTVDYMRMALCFVFG
ncbi:uncharacterized protein LOC6580198 [Drosophila mojavensis]|uniref:Uncharacterized protein n=2 Tax=mojavensis species complex TaxID=198037 RepID=B4KND8_DROMO|nr:uncharacterized protein LOC6580198 [Drosophila mojavensis]XP_017868120.1 PREDICTED: uncharacterized protein LOC108617019 [Drosophila arizonae]EDW09991.1 uncharacterized protein Dmoj_GI20821 [Drosophila mojavensis]